MAHTCPDCGQLCHCGGDIDDIEWGEDSEESDNCSHYLSPYCTDPNDYEEEWDDAGDREGFHG